MPQQPYGQQQQQPYGPYDPYGQQPPQGQRGYLGQYGYPPAEPRPPRQSRRSRRGWRLLGSWAGNLLLGVLGIAVLVGIGYAYEHFTGDPKAVAKVGDCLSGTDEDDIKVVSCSDPAVTYKVVGRIERVSETTARFRDDICARYRKADTVFWEGTETNGVSGTGTVLCLEEKKK